MICLIHNAMSVPSKFMIAVLSLFSLSVTGLAGWSFAAEDDGGSAFRIGEHEIANDFFRLGLTPDPARPDVPYLTGYRKTGEEWSEAFSWSLIGARFVGEHANIMNQRYGRYGSPFRNCEPGMEPYRVVMENIRTGVQEGMAFFSFRISREEIWANIRIRLVATEPLLLFEQEAASPGIQSYVILHLRSLPQFSHYVFGPIAIPSRPVGDSAQKFAQTGYLMSARYTGVYRPTFPDYFIFSWPRDLKQPRRIWPYSGAQELPFAMFAGSSKTGGVDIETLGHQGERVRALAQDFFPAAK